MAGMATACLASLMAAMEMASMDKMFPVNPPARWRLWRSSRGAGTGIVAVNADSGGSGPGLIAYTNGGGNAINASANGTGYAMNATGNVQSIRHDYFRVPSIGDEFSAHWH